VPDDLALTAVGGPKEGLPVVLLEDGGVRLWQRTDLRFKNPKATIVLDFQVGREGALWCVLWCVLLMMSNGVCCSNR
jgi:hypothetical protein